MADLTAVEARLWSLLEPYRAELEEATIYGMPSLRWPGARAHDYFVAVKPAKAHVSLFAVGIDRWPDVLDDASPALLRRRTGKATFSFHSLDDELAADLEAMLARLFVRYRERHGTT